jgi:hypothetical protein
MAVVSECGSIQRQRFLSHNFDVDVHMFDATSDSRIQRRQRVLKKALIVFNHGHATIGCQVLDLSDTGAKLMPVDVVSCPREFVLKLPTDRYRNCEVKWRKGTVLGVQFVGAEQPVKTPDDRRQYLRRRTLQQALIVYNRGLATTASQIVDISESGAKLIIAHPFVCPREFVLKPKHGGPRQCTLLWRKGNTIGARFV